MVAVAARSRAEAVRLAPLSRGDDRGHGRVSCRSAGFREGGAADRRRNGSRVAPARSRLRGSHRDGPDSPSTSIGTAAVIAGLVPARGLRAGGSTRSRRSGCSWPATRRSTWSRRSRTASMPCVRGARTSSPTANSRALWALLWFLVVYHCGAWRGGRAAAAGGRRGRWSTALVRRAQRRADRLGAGLLRASRCGSGERPSSSDAEEPAPRVPDRACWWRAILLLVTGRSRAAAAGVDGGRADVVVSVRR